MTSNWQDGILLVILLFVGLILISIDLITSHYAKTKASKNLIIWDDAGRWFNARDYLQYCQVATLLGATGVIISFEEESKNES